MPSGVPFPANSDTLESGRLLIGGQWLAADSEETFETLDPASGLPIARVAKGGPVDIDRAVCAARSAFEAPDWSGLSIDERAVLLWRYAELIDADGERLTEMEVRDNGMSMLFAQWGVAAAARWLRHFAGVAGRAAGQNQSAAASSTAARFHAYTSREPVGVVGLIIPWNGPIATFAIKVAPALAAGCTCVVKPAEQTPLTALRLGELALEAGIPAGVINVVTGFGDAGSALVEHPGVDKISFTGSTETGRSVLRGAAGTIKRITLELGGKSPCIVFDDADMAQAIPGAAGAIFANSGQVCFAGSRLYVQRSSFDRVAEGVAAAARALKIGSGLEPATEIGPLISHEQRERVSEYVRLGREDGAEVLAGGGEADREGFFFRPTVLTNLAASSRVVREEIFGPVVVMTPFDEMEEVVALANDTNYGLGAGIFTSNVSTAHTLARRLRAGNVWINTYGVTDPSMPFGGFKQSGIGRELGDQGLDAFLETKSVFIGLGQD